METEQEIKKEQTLSLNHQEELKDLAEQIRVTKSVEVDHMSDGGFYRATYVKIVARAEVAVNNTVYMFSAEYDNNFYTEVMLGNIDDVIKEIENAIADTERRAVEKAVRFLLFDKRLKSLFALKNDINLSIRYS